MTHDGEKEICALLRRVAVSLESIVAALAPETEARTHKPAVLGTAIYDTEERKRVELRQTLSGKGAGLDSHQAGEADSGDS